MRVSFLTLLICLITIPAYAKYSGGMGVPNDPYQIATAADLIALGETPADYDKHFILTADIDLDPNLPGRKVFDRSVIAPDTNDVADWFQGTAFIGVFDGDGHTISHLTIIGASNLGLFGQLDFGCEVRDVGLLAVSITGSGNDIGSSRAGGLVGLNCGNVTQCNSTGIVSGGSSVGGLVGYNYGGSVTQCYSGGVVSGSSSVGGLVGFERPRRRFRTITDSYSTATVSAITENAGGLVGYNEGTIVRCYSMGPVAAAFGAGGLVGGEEYSGSVTDCFWDIETSGQAVSAGGVGKTTAEMQTADTFLTWGACGSFWMIDDGRDYPHLAWENVHGEIIPGPTYGGGTGTAQDPYIIATAEHLTTLGLCSCHGDKHFKLLADIDLSNGTWAGAVVPSFSGVFDGNGHIISGLTITGEGSLGLFGQLVSGAYVKNLGVIDLNIAGSGDYVGGLVGHNDGTVTHCYSTGSVSGTGSYVGGLAGYNSGDMTHCYSAGSVSGENVGGLVGNNSGEVVYCYSAGLVSGTGSGVGGLVGAGNDSPISVMHSVWDVETSGLSVSTGGVGLTTAEMMDPYILGLNGFADDPNWVLDAGRDYPRLVWEATPGTIIPEPNIGWLEGHGTAEEPYRIEVADQLVLLGRASLLWDRHFVLGADIDLDPNLPNVGVFGQAVVPVFSGVFDGNGHTISHLTIKEGSYLGLFGWVLDPNSEIRNVGLIDPNVTGSSYLGALVGWLENGTISDCYVTGGRVSGNNMVGGLAGRGPQSGGAIIRCFVQDANVSARLMFGGSGGLTSFAGSGTIQDCRVTSGVVRGASEVGGLAGIASGTVISGCCTSTRVEAGSDQSDALFLMVGGLIGRNDGTIENCYATGSVSEGSLLDIDVWKLFGTGAGGLVGYNSGAVHQSYSTGTVTGTVYVGGLLGGDNSNVWNMGVATACFWDIETSGQTTSAGGMGKTTAEMQTARTFLEAGWDFVDETENGTDDIWWILEGRDYPRLWWELSD